MSGQVAFYSLATLTNPKLVKIFSQVHGRVPLAMQVYGVEQMGQSGVYHLNFISCDNEGVVQTNRIRKTTFNYGIEKSTLFDRSTLVHQMCRQQVVGQQQKLVVEACALVSQDQVQVVVLEPFIDIVFKKGYPSTPPNILCVKWHSESNISHLMVGNGTYLEVVVMVGTKESNKLDIQFQVSRRLKLNSDAQISSLHWLSANIVFVKVAHRHYYLLDTTKFVAEHETGDNFRESLIAQGSIDFDVSEQTYLNDQSKYSGCLSNTIIGKNNQ